MNITRDTSNMMYYHCSLSLDAMRTMPAARVDDFGSLCMHNVHIIGVTAEGEVDMDTWHRGETSTSWRDIQ